MGQTRQAIKEAENAMLVHRSQRRAAAALGISRRTLRDRLRAAEKAAIAAPVSPPPAPPAISSSIRGSVLRVLAIGDVHDSPHLVNKDRARWIGSYIRTEGFDQVIFGGDLANFDSIGGYGSKFLFDEEIQSLGHWFDAFQDGLGGAKPNLHVCLGNHDTRPWRCPDESPSAKRLYQQEFLGLIDHYGLAHSRYGELHMHAGVGFLHVPVNGYGKAVGGKNAMQNVARDAVHDLVFFDSHQFRWHQEPKIGGHTITVVNAGCCLPQGHVQPYAQHRTVGWAYGVVPLTIKNNRIIGGGLTSMDELKARFYA